MKNAKNGMNVNNVYVLTNEKTLVAFLYPNYYNKQSNR